MGYIVAWLYLHSVLLALTQAKINTIGRPAELGLYYNSVHDKIIYVSSLTTKLPTGSSFLLPAGDFECKSKIVRSTVDKFNSMHLNLETQINILSGIVEAKGAASFATNSNSVSETIQGVLRYSSSAVYEGLHTRLPSVQELFSLFPGQSVLGATEVIVGIEWGYRLNFVFEMQSTGNYTQDVAEMDLTIASVAAAINSKVEFKMDKRNGAQKSTFKIHTYGDMILPYIPQSVEEVYDLLKQVPELLSNSPTGKGIPQYIIVMEIEDLQALIDYDLHNEPFHKNNTHVNNTLLTIVQNDLMAIYWNKDVVAVELASLNNQITKYNDIFNHTVINAVKELQFKFTTTFDKFNSQFKQCLIEARKGAATRAIEMIKTSSGELKDHAYGLDSVLKIINQDYSFVKSKIVDYNIFKKYGVQYLQNDWTTTQALNNNIDLEISFLFYKESWKKANSSFWRSISKTFIKSKGLRFVVDCDNKFHYTHSCLPEIVSYNHTTFFLTRFHKDSIMKFYKGKKSNSLCFTLPSY